MIHAAPSTDHDHDPATAAPGVEAAGAADVAAVGRPEAAPGHWEPRVLVVDDDPVCRIAAERLLHNIGLAVDVAVDGHQAVEMTAEWPYVAVFMDCSMPEIDGYRTTRAIHARDGRDHTPLIIAATARPRHVCLASGMDHHIPKPLRLDALRGDCAMLGLLAPDRSGATPAAVAAAAGEPLLAGRSGADSPRLIEAAVVFVDRAVRHLPSLWRAANLLDTSAMARVADELARRAASAGAPRAVAVCRQLADAARRVDAAVAAALEPAVRAVLRDTRLAAPDALAALAGGAPRDLAARPDPPAVVRVAVADDDALARLAVETMVTRGDRLELVGSATNVDEIVDLVGAARPHVALLDFYMPGGGGPEAARRISEVSPQTRVIALTAWDRPDAYLAMLRAGAVGLLVKGRSPQRVVEMIHRAAEQPLVS